MFVQRLGDALRPVQSADRCRSQRGQDRQVGAEVVHLAQMFDDLQKFKHILFAVSLLFAAQDLRPRPEGDVVEVFGEGAQIGGPFVLLLLDADQNLRNLDEGWRKQMVSIGWSARGANNRGNVNTPQPTVSGVMQIQLPE